jgi:hypothetical protein
MTIASESAIAIIKSIIFILIIFFCLQYTFIYIFNFVN